MQQGSCILVIMLFNILIFGQSSKVTLDYFLPAIQYDTKIPTPEQYLGYQVGEWHVTHDQLVGYFKALDAASEKMEIIEYARSHENRPLLVALISSVENIQKKDAIRKAHQDLSDATQADKVDIKALPAMLWQGYSIHGNESSANNAAMLVAYYLLAGQSKEVEETLKNTMILLDPCLNPDGVQRFSTWVNANKSKHLVSDPESREFSETWPGGRYNHYWFDMNRDWLFLVHPESRGRIKMLHDWHPNVLGDHHEMGTNATYFFHPGAPASNNPNTPGENFVLTEEIGKFHAKALDSIGSLYYTKTNFDDFYYGKGSTYPDAIGAIGILFEQASSRGHLQESINGPVSFPFTIRNQVVTSLSTQKAAVALRSSLLQFKKGFYKKVKETLAKENIKGYIFSDADEIKVNRFLDVLLQHHVDVYLSDADQTIDNKVFAKNKSYIVPLDQAQPILAKTIFESVKTFQDSSFYDVSGWTLSYGFGLVTAPLTSVNYKKDQKITQLPTIQSGISGPKQSVYAYLIEPNQYATHKMIYALQSNGINVRISQAHMPTSSKTYPMGTAIIHVESQTMDKKQLSEIIEKLAKTHEVKVDAIAEGNGTSIVTIGHPQIFPIEKPKVAFITGPGMSAQSAGAIWHHLDLNLGIPATMMEGAKLKNTNLSRYNTLVMSEGSYNAWSDQEVNKLKEWCAMGNTIIAIGSAASWLNDKKIIQYNTRKNERQTPSKVKYEDVERNSDASVIGGTILACDAELTHPLLYGTTENMQYMMKTNSRFVEPTSNKYATPLRYSKNFLASGYLPKGMESTITGAASLTVHQTGRGKIICFHDDPLFRGYWYHGQKMFNNALFYAPTIDRRTTESAE
jgi:hypothetical protein